MAKASKILTGAVLLLLASCSTKYEEVAPDTELLVNVGDATGAALEGADVYVFEDSTAFHQTLQTGNPAGFLATATTTGGTARLEKLGYDAIYFIYVSYKDNSLFPGTFITLDNTDDNFVLKNKLVRGSVTTVQITVKPADGFITFWTAASNVATLPIDLYQSNQLVGSVTQTASFPPPPFQPSGLTVRARKGQKIFEGKSTAGCLWADALTVIPVQNTSYRLIDCTVGTVAFYTDNTNTAILPITIKLNANDPVGSINLPAAAPPADCSAANLTISYRVPGDYTYEALSSTGQCVWTGTFTMTANNCNLIFIPTCN